MSQSPIFPQPATQVLVGIVVIVAGVVVAAVVVIGAGVEVVTAVVTTTSVALCVIEQFGNL